MLLAALNEAGVTDEVAGGKIMNSRIDRFHIGKRGVNLSDFMLLLIILPLLPFRNHRIRLAMLQAGPRILLWSGQWQ